MSEPMPEVRRWTPIPRACPERCDDCLRHGLSRLATVAGRVKGELRWLCDECRKAIDSDEGQS